MKRPWTWIGGTSMACFSGTLALRRHAAFIPVTCHPTSGLRPVVSNERPSSWSHVGNSCRVAPRSFWVLTAARSGRGESRKPRTGTGPKRKGSAKGNSDDDLEEEKGEVGEILGMPAGARVEDDDVDDDEYEEGEEEEELPEHLKRLLERPAMSLEELLAEAKIDFSDPELVDEEAFDVTKFRAGFVAIVGSPNVGKSTLMNALVGEKVSIVTPKQQTTRHQIMGVVTGDDYQIAYYDTPGMLRPDYKLQEGMMAFVRGSLEDADVVLMMTDVFEDPKNFPDEDIFEQLRHSKRPLLLAINKVDVLPNATHPEGKLTKDRLAEVGTLDDVVSRWRAALPSAELLPISARERMGLDELLDAVKRQLPIGPPLYPNDTLTDKTQRFFASEIIREKIFLSYQKEVPYSCEVAVTAFKEAEALLKINATIFASRDAHVPILIGAKGSKLKSVGTDARKDLEEFFGKKVFLEMHVKVKKDWRSKESDLKAFGYLQEE